MYWPLSGKFSNNYKYFMFWHSAGVMVYWVARIAFEEKPGFAGVRFEWYLDFIFLIDMIRIFNSPIFTETGKKIMEKQTIAKAYLFSWFLWDLWCFYPLGWLRYRSKRSEGSLDNWDNWMQQNYQRLPRFYKILLLL